MAVLWVVASGVLTSVGSSAVAAEPDSTYQRARRSFFSFKNDPGRRQYRHHWFRVIKGFQAVSTKFPEHALAARALYTEAELWKGLYGVSRKHSDLAEALSKYELVELNHPASSLADDALWQRSQLFLHKMKRLPEAAYEVSDLLRRYPEGDMAKRARATARELEGTKPHEPDDRRSAQLPFLRGRPREGEGQTLVSRFSHWSNDSYSRVSIHLDGACEITTGQVEFSSQASLPSRVFVDLHKTSLPSGFEEPIDINDRLLGRIRVAPNGADSVRVALDLKAHTVEHRVLVLENPFRVLIDVYGGAGALDSSATRAGSTISRRVVIDPGHGGHDSGASGVERLLEKDVVLKIGRRVQSYLEREGVEVVLTRDNDTFVSLEERTAIANRAGADAFISIHANSHEDPTVRGIETYYLDVTDDQYAIRLAALENQTKREKLKDVHLALSELAARVNTPDSKRLATGLQANLVQLAARTNKGTRNLGVKASLFYVLLGVRMPSALVETSFISNPQEGRLLSTGAYQEQLAAAIAKGVLDHFNSPSED